MSTRFSLFALLVAAPLATAACSSSIEFVVPDDGGGDGDAQPDTRPDGAQDVETCADDQCGPIPPTLPPEQCWDGSWSGMTGSCVKRADGTCGWETRECPPAKVCGPIPGGDCPGETYCKRAEGTCFLLGGTGTCALRPSGCNDLWAPVCGCDGMTYGNACGAASAGVNVERSGECGVVPSGCTQATVTKDCGTESICKLAIGVCGSGARGSCVAYPKVCPATYAPVCGCDGKTYSNGCVADQANVGIASNGACTNVKSCGGFGGFTCASSDFCDYPLAEMCGAADGSGVCQPRPTVCGKNYDPVCACDGRTYSNSCLANMAGFGVYYKGTCK